MLPIGGSCSPGCRRVNHVIVPASCASREFDAYVRVWPAGGNTVAIENHAETNTFLFNH